MGREKRNKIISLRKVSMLLQSNWEVRLYYFTLLFYFIYLMLLNKNVYTTVS